MLTLRLQKPSRSSKSEDHHAALERRLKLWEEVKIEELLYKGQNIQEKLKSPDSCLTIAKISMKFRILVSKGNVHEWRLNVTNEQHGKGNFTTYRGDTTASKTKAC